MIEEAVVTSLIRLVAAVVVGGLIGLERTYHGRPAGFRTHTLVCTASSLLMLVTVYQVQLLPHLPLDILRVDPTRMAQGIMTGIGFLGAGVIMKEGLSVRGLTTAASIWITAAIGILIGMGFYFPSAVATLLTLGTLAVFRWIETSMPSLFYGRLRVRFRRREHLSEEALDAMIEKHNISGANTSYRLAEAGKFFEYELTIRSREAGNFRHLAETLSSMEKVLEFELRPVGEK